MANSKGLYSEGGDVIITIPKRLWVTFVFAGILAGGGAGTGVSSYFANVDPERVRPDAWTGTQAREAHNHLQEQIHDLRVRQEYIFGEQKRRTYVIEEARQHMRDKGAHNGHGHDKAK